MYTFVLSILGLILTRLDVVTGETRFLNFEAWVVEHFSLSTIHERAVHLAKHPCGAKHLMMESIQTGTSAEELCAKADQNPPPTWWEILPVYLMDFPVLSKLILALPMWAARKMLTVTGGRSPVKFIGVLFLLAATIVHFSTSQ